MITLHKQDPLTDLWQPLEKGCIKVSAAGQLTIRDGAGRAYLDVAAEPDRPVAFRARGTAGHHQAVLGAADGREVARCSFRLRPETRWSCDAGPYAALANRLGANMRMDGVEATRRLIEGKLYAFLVCWGRDHNYVLKSMKYYFEDVKTGIEFFLERQQPNGMFWDDCHENVCRPMPNWFNEALGEGNWDYTDGDEKKYTLRRIPIEADVEYLYTECVWHAWKASGDDAWMAAQLPILERALAYNSSHPTRWSEQHGLVRRSFCMDSWDFANPHYCHGDHRCLNPGDPQFLFHADNSGLYASHWRMAEMYEHLGNTTRATELREAGEALRQRANEKLFFGTNYGHMIPETLPEDEVYALVGDERQRLSLSTGYTINRKLPTHEMAVAILREYQRRREANRDNSHAEWWSMDPMYDDRQWPGVSHTTYSQGEYMNGAISPLVAGELARAAFAHGLEDYGVDILRRLWDLSERDGGYVHSAYKRLPAELPQPHANFLHVDLRGIANVGLKHDAHPGVPAWTDEGANDMHNLPVGKRRFGDPATIEFDVIDPAANDGKAVLYLDGSGMQGPARVTIPVPRLRGRSLYFMQALAHSAKRYDVVAVYDIVYADRSEVRWYVRANVDVGLWWGIHDREDTRKHHHPVDRSRARVAWRGPNGEWKNVGLYMTGWTNPHPEKAIVAIRCGAEDFGPARGGIMLAAVSVSDEPVCFEHSSRSGGLPATWSQSSVYHGLAEGLAGIEDTGRAFSRARVSPRWSITEAEHAQVCLAYPASHGYCAYELRHDRQAKTLSVDLTGAFAAGQLRVLLPPGTQAQSVRLGEQELAFTHETVEQSTYAVTTLAELPRSAVVVSYG